MRNLGHASGQNAGQPVPWDRHKQFGNGTALCLGNGGSDHDAIALGQPTRCGHTHISGADQGQSPLEPFQDKKRKYEPR